MKQITIVSENRPGIVAEIAEALANAGLNIEAFAAQAVGNSAVTILTTDQYDLALKALAQTPFSAITEDALVVQMDDKPGELARITRRLKDANINLNSIRIVRRGGGKCIVAIATERTEDCLALLKDALIT